MTPFFLFVEIDKLMVARRAWYSRAGDNIQVQDIL